MSSPERHFTGRCKHCRRRYSPMKLETMIPCGRPESLFRPGLIVLLLCALSAGPAWAQLGDDESPSSGYEQPERQVDPYHDSQSSRPPSSLPDWAEPNESPRGVPTTAQRNDDPPGPPCPGGNCGGGDDPGREVPLGGLEWLLAAGFGYGFWKLKDAGIGRTSSRRQ